MDNTNIKEFIEILKKECIFKDQKIRINNQYVSVFDIISVVGGQKNPKETWYNLLSKYESEVVDLNIIYFKFSGRGQKNTPVIDILDILDIKKIILLILPGARLSVNRKNEIIKIFNITEIDNKNHYLREYIEEEIHENLIRAFKNYKIKQQFSILSYRIDLYFLDFKLAIECDEDNHNNYNKNNEIKRQNLITNELNCAWIRYNPYKNFNIFDLIHEINIKLIDYK